MSEKSAFNMLAIITSVSTVLAAGLAYVQFFSDTSETSERQKISLLQRIAAAVEMGNADDLSEEEIKEGIVSSKKISQRLAEAAAKNQLKGLPVVYLDSSGVSVKQGNSAEFTTPNGSISILGNDNVKSGSTVRLLVDGRATQVNVGASIASIADPSCRYHLSEINDSTKEIRIRFVCDSSASQREDA